MRATVQAHAAGVQAARMASSVSGGLRLGRRCTSALELQQLVTAAGSVLRHPPSASPFTRLLGVEYDTVGSIILPGPQARVWLERAASSKGCPA